MTKLSDTEELLRAAFAAGVEQGNDEATSWEWGSRPTYTQAQAFQNFLNHALSTQQRAMWTLRYEITANGKPLLRTESLALADWAIKARAAWHADRPIRPESVVYEIYDHETRRTIREMKVAAPRLDSMIDEEG